jgi:hypothetical protein
LANELRLTRIRKVLGGQGLLIAYPTLYHFVVVEPQLGRTVATIPILDGAPDHELRLDNGWVGRLTLPLLARKGRRFRAWIVTVRSRDRFVTPDVRDTVRAIEACEAA